MRELLIDFSSSPFLMAEINTGQEPEVAVTVDDEVTVRAPWTTAAPVPSFAHSDAQIIPALRKNFPAIRNHDLREHCWRAIFDRLAPCFQKMTQNTPPACLKVHAIFPQTWRATEADEFRTALKSLGIPAGQVASETACLACLIAPELYELADVSAPDPLNVAVMVCDCERSRWWSFEWFRGCAPGLLCLTDYAPAWTQNYAPAISRSDILIVLGKPETAEMGRPNATSSYTVERPFQFPLLQAGTVMLQRLDGLHQPAKDLRVEMAPSLAWRWGQRSQITALPSSALLSSSNFPLRVEKECSYLGKRDHWDSVAFWLEAAWGKAPESWSPLALVQLPASLLRRWKGSEGLRCIKLTLQMPAPSSGKITLESIETDGPTFHDCSEFKLGSALA
jgi:hypothetical protein